MLPTRFEPHLLARYRIWKNIPILYCTHVIPLNPKDCCLNFLCRHVCDRIFPVKGSVVWHLECVTSVSPYHFVCTLNTGTENPVTQGNDFKDSRDQRFKYCSLSNSDIVGLSVEHASPNLNTSVIATCKHNAEILDSMLVAWENFKGLNPLKIVAIIFTTCSDNTNTWNLCVFFGSHVNLRIRSDYFCK